MSRNSEYVQIGWIQVLNKMVNTILFLDLQFKSHQRQTTMDMNILRELPNRNLRHMEDGLQIISSARISQHLGCRLLHSLNSFSNPRLHILARGKGGKFYNRKCGVFPPRARHVYKCDLLKVEHHSNPIKMCQQNH